MNPGPVGNESPSSGNEADPGVGQSTGQLAAALPDTFQTSNTAVNNNNNNHKCLFLYVIAGTPLSEALGGDALHQHTNRISEYKLCQAQEAFRVARSYEGRPSGRTQVIGRDALRNAFRSPEDWHDAVTLANVPIRPLPQDDPAAQEQIAEGVCHYILLNIEYAKASRQALETDAKATNSKTAKKRTAQSTEASGWKAVEKRYILVQWPRICIEDKQSGETQYNLVETRFLAGRPHHKAYVQGPMVNGLRVLQHLHGQEVMSTKQALKRLKKWVCVTLADLLHGQICVLMTFMQATFTCLLRDCTADSKTMDVRIHFREPRFLLMLFHLPPRSAHCCVLRMCSKKWA